jgi:hypothetical protein
MRRRKEMPWGNKNSLKPSPLKKEMKNPKYQPKTRAYCSFGN